MTAALSILEFRTNCHRITRVSLKSIIDGQEPKDSTSKV